MSIVRLFWISLFRATHLFKVLRRNSKIYYYVDVVTLYVNLSYTYVIENLFLYSNQFYFLDSLKYTRRMIYFIFSFINLPLFEFLLFSRFSVFIIIVWLKKFELKTVIILSHRMFFLQLSTMLLSLIKMVMNVFRSRTFFWL